MRFMVVYFLVAAAGCGAVIEPGHRGLLFKPRAGGLQHDVLGPGYHRVGVYGRIDDFDVTYSTKKELLHTISQEGLSMNVRVAIIYRPVVSELYDLDTEIGPNYYDEVVGPEFRTATRGVFARHSYAEVQRINEKVEDEIEAEVRRRISGKHIEISSVTLEALDYAPEIAAARQATLVGEQDAIRRKTAQEAEAARQSAEQIHNAERAQFAREQEAQKAKMEADAATMRQANELRLDTERSQHAREQAELKAQMDAEATLREKQNERALAEEQAAIEKVQAQITVAKAKADAQAITVLAKAHAAEKRAEASTLTPLKVQMEVMSRGFDALSKLGGEGTSFIFGDWSHVPSFLFPQTPAYRGLFPGMGGDSSKPIASRSTRNQTSTEVTPLE
jgi:regulator of protease activity HflC (stomatin/prohibitin superfamily)